MNLLNQEKVCDTFCFRQGIGEFCGVDAELPDGICVTLKYIDMADINNDKPYIITIGTDNRPGGVEGEFHVQFKPDIMRVTFGEQEEVAKEFGGTMRVTKGQEWADFYHEADAVKFAEKIVGMNQERETAANKKKEDAKITVKGSHGKVLNLIPSDDPVKNRIVETLKDRLVFHDAKSVDDVLDNTKDSYEMKVWNRLNKELWEIAYRKNNSDISLNISPSDDLSKIKVIEHERRYYGQSDIDEPVGDFDLKDLSSGKVAMEKTDTHPEQSNDDISKVGFFKSNSGKNTGKYILYWEDDKGKNHRVYDLLDRKERYIISAFFKAVKEGRKEEFLNDLVSKLSKAQEKEVKKSDTNTSSESKLNEVVDSYKAVIAASHKLIDDPRKWELHKLARVLIGVDNGTDERYHSLTPEEKMEFYKEMASCEKDTRYAESFKAIDKLSGGKMSLLASLLTDNDDINMVTAIEAVQSPERSILSGKYNGGLIVYHGTAYHDVPFDKFEEDKPIWFTSDLSYAKGYAESRTGMMGKRAFENFEYFELDDFKYTRDDAKDMLRVNQDLRITRLDLKNPAIIGEPHDYLYPDKLILWLKDLSARLDIPFEELDSIKLPDYVGDWHNQNRDVDTVDFIHNPDFMKILENHGYDGMVTTEYGDYHVYCYAAFHNDQIREITPNDQEWNLVDTAAKQLKAAYRASWVEEGHREEVFDTVEKIFKERPSISPKERLQGGFLDKRFEKMGIKLMDNVKEQAVQALHDRITDRNARVFTQDQRNLLVRYRELMSLTSAEEVFSDLKKDVLNDPDVMRCSEKWSKDAFKELDDLAEGITREQGQGLKR